MGIVAAVIVAAGRGQRVGGDMPKQYRDIAGRPVIRPTLEAFAGHAQIDVIQPVIHPADEDLFRGATQRPRQTARSGRRRRDTASLGARRACRLWRRTPLISC